MSALFGPVFGEPTDAVADTDWLEAMLQAEAALATACAAVGLITEADAEQVQDATKAGWLQLDPTEIAAGGNPVIPLVRQLRERVGPAVHFGATSQDIIDTAGMLIARERVTRLSTQVSDAAATCDRLAADHRDTPMIGRTLLQQAEPITFGVVAAGWASGLARATTTLTGLQFAAQLAGPVGTGTGWQPHADEVRRRYAELLELTDPGGSWHTERSRISELAAALGLTAAVIGRIATDVVLLSQTELGEVSEASPGGSSAMPHKQNPIAAITARAGAAQAPGLVATLLSATTGSELQRGAGSWHAEWPALERLFSSVGGAAQRLGVSLTGLRIHPDAMRRNLDTFLTRQANAQEATGA